MRLKSVLLNIVICVSLGALYGEQAQPHIKPRVPIKLHVPHNFGKTNFIIGFPHEYEQTTQVPNETTTDQTDEVHEAFFSPDDDLQKKLISYIKEEQTAIYLAIFSFTDKEIAQALCEAKKRGVHIEIVVDTGCLSDRFGKISRLRDAGITVYVYDPTQSAKHGAAYSNIMHNKFAIFMRNKNNKTLVWTGSFNFTKSARITNQENVVVTSEPNIVAKFKQQFNVLKCRTLPYDARHKHSMVT